MYSIIIVYKMNRAFQRKMKYNNLCFLFALLCYRVTKYHRVTGTVRGRNPSSRHGDDSNKRRQQLINNTKKKKVVIEPRIVGGKPARKGVFPSYGIPIYGGELCGASIIHNDILVSAGHCAGAFQGNSIAIGSTHRDGSDAIAIIEAVQEFVHPYFSRSTLENDIMLIQLASPVSSSDIPIVRRNYDSSLPVTGEHVQVIGFGLTSDGGQPSDELLQVTLEVVDYGTCSNAYKQPWGKSPIIESNMICAGATQQSNIPADSCQGDSGGPMFNVNGTLIGIVSFGSGCGQNGIPGVYTRVSAYDDFIRHGICQLSASPPEYCSTSSSSENGVEVLGNYEHSSGGGADDTSSSGSLNNIDGNTETDTTSDHDDSASDVPSSSLVVSDIPTSMLAITPSPSPSYEDEDEDEDEDDDSMIHQQPPPSYEEDSMIHHQPSPSEDSILHQQQQQDCTVGCTVAWAFSGLVLHMRNGSTCTEICAVMYIESFLANGYQCGLCLNN